VGRDEDVEEWLATDTSLDRPVLVRTLGPESSAHRRGQFVSSVGAAGQVSHQHLCKVYAVGEVDGGAYAVVEWTGGSTAEDHVEAAQRIELAEFLPNAAGLAGALAALHEHGLTHGAIDLSAISYSVAHPAKLSAFGREPRTDAAGDVRALANALETGLTGSPPGGPPPSERVDGLPRQIDRILRSAQSGSMSAGDLSKALSAAPTPRAPAPEPRVASMRLLIVALILVLIAVGLVGVGYFFSGSANPVLPPPASTSPSATTTTLAPPVEGGEETLPVQTSFAFDPYGEGGENDDLVPALTDDDTSTEWRTEIYQAPLAEAKPGVGLAFGLVGTPSRVQLVGLSTGTVFEIYWATSFVPDPEQWSRVAGAEAPPGATYVDLPPRADGYWLLWLVDLPQQDDGSYSAGLAEVRFLP
jgi:serine/threonine protein kinase